jgi:PPK2 family polyphosphate:nucleotide phosphotransferase
MAVTPATSISCTIAGSYALQTTRSADRLGYGLGMLNKILIAPGKRANLSRRKPDETFGWEKVAAKKELAKLVVRLSDLQNKLAAESKQSLLVVIQAMDAAGKDGVIRSIFTGVNPSGVKVTAYKAPSTLEMSHDYLWRIHQALPARGQIGIFNRSHYEDVLVVRVHKFVPEEQWQKRFRHIREFERMITDEGTRIVKIHLQISLEAQRLREQDRIDTIDKRWKFNKQDLVDRNLWPQFMKAYEDVFVETGTEYAPWYVIPSDRNWVRNLAVAQILVHTLENMNPQFPPGQPDIETIRVV